MMSLTGQNTCVGILPSGQWMTLSQSSPTPAWTSLPPCSSLKPAQSGFRKVSSTGEAGPCPIPGLPDGVLEMRVKEGSKIRNLLGFAMTRMQGGVKHGSQSSALSQVLFSGSGRAITKTITCAEIMKRQISGLHQVSKLQYCTVREEWEGRDDACSRMTIHRMVPSICILLSKEALNPQEPGYQPPEELHSDSDHRIPEAHLCSSPDYGRLRSQPPHELHTSSRSHPREPVELLYTLSDHSQPGYRPLEKLRFVSQCSKLGCQASAQPSPPFPPCQAAEEQLSEGRESTRCRGVPRKRHLGHFSPSSQPKAKAALFEEGNV